MEAVGIEPTYDAPPKAADSRDFLDEYGVCQRPGCWDSDGDGVCPRCYGGNSTQVRTQEVQ